MYCPNCGHQNEVNAKFCMSCGKPIINTEQKVQDSLPPASPSTSEPGRGGLILTFGILSLLLLGPILGIPAWVMGHHDMKKIRGGIIAISNQGLTKAGMILGIIGTFVSVFTVIIIGIAIAVGISMFKTNAQTANRDQIINDLNNVAAKAQQYYRKPKVMDGGGESFVGFTLSDVDVANANGFYQISDGTPSVGDYDPSAGGAAMTRASVIIVGWGTEIGNDGTHKVQAYATVTKDGIICTVLN